MVSDHSDRRYSIQKPGISCFCFRGEGASVSPTCKECGCGFVVSEMFTNISVLFDVRDRMFKFPDDMDAERPLALRRADCDASGSSGLAESRKTVNDIMDHYVVEDAKGVFFCVDVEQDGRAACA